MKTRKLPLGIFVIGMALVCGTIAKGETSQIYVTGSLDWDMGANTGMTGSLSIPQFDPALGVLDSVEIFAQCNYSSSVTVLGPAGASGQVEASGSVIVQDPGNNISISHNLYGSWEGNYSLPTVPNCNGADAGYTPAALSYDGPAVLSEFTGNGNFNLLITGSQSVGLMGPGSLEIDSASLDTFAGVTYVYTVPEPGSCALLVVGFGIMLTRRSMRKLLDR